jgi:hypothetical protein
MAQVLLISENYIKTNSNISESIDSKLLTSSILSMQDLNLEPLIGTGLFEAIKTQAANNTLTTPNATLLNNYLQRTLLYWVLKDCLPFVHIKINNKGLQRHSDPNSQPVDMGDLKRMGDLYEKKGYEYARRTSLFIRENIEDYPLYDNPGDGLDIINPQKPNTTGGMYLRRKTIPYGITIDKGKYNCD